LYGFGGLAIPQRDVNGVVPRVLVALAGPVAGFCLAGLNMVAIVMTGGRVFSLWYMYMPHLGAMVNIQLLVRTLNSRLYYGLTTFVNDLLYVNFYWGLVNLLPVWPLDGGHVSRALFENQDSYDGRRKSLIVSAAVAGSFALVGLAEQDMWVAFLFGILAVASVQALQGERRRAIPAYRRYRDC
jgi:Zn-dependent protease